jgi:hypothetical protein
VATEALPGVRDTTTVSVTGSDVRFRPQDRHRDELEALVLVLATLGVILLVVLTLGSSVPVGS